MNNLYFAMVLILVYIIILAIYGIWYMPAPFFALVMNVSFAIPMLLAPELEVTAFGFVWILILLLCFVIGCLIVDLSGGMVRDDIRLGRRVNPDKDNWKIQDSNLPYIRAFLLITMFVGIISNIMVLMYLRINIGKLTSLRFIIESGSNISILRYTYGYDFPIYIDVFRSFIFLSPILGGILYRMKSLPFRRILAFLSLVPAINEFIIQTTRATIIMSVVLWLSGYIVYGIETSLIEKDIRLSFRTTILILLIIIIVLVSFSMGELIRAKKEISAQSIKEAFLTKRARGSILAHAFAFMNWASDEWKENNDLALGRYTFAGVYNIFNIGTRKQGIFEESWYSRTGIYTNVYTYLRGVIEDFGFTGSAIFFFLLGLITSYIFRKVSIGKSIFTPILIMIYSYIGFYATSIFNYNTIIVALVLFALCYQIVKRKRKIVEEGSSLNSVGNFN